MLCDAPRCTQADFQKEDTELGRSVERIEVADYTGEENSFGFYKLEEVQLDLQTYTLRPDTSSDPRRNIAQAGDDELPQARVLPLPSVALKDEWNSLVFDDGLPARLLRYLTRMLGMMKQQGLDFSKFNWNRLCLLHGPPG